MQYIGLDLAWSSKNPTGAAVLSGDRTGAVLTETRLLGSDDEVLDFVAAQAPAGPCLIAVDAPLAVPNLTAQRPGELALARVFGGYQAGAHPANREHLTRYNGGQIRGEVLVERLARLGFVHDPAQVQQDEPRAVVEVYPHPAMVALFGLTRTLKYKRKRQELARMHEDWATYHTHLARLDRAEPPLSGLEPLLAHDPAALKGRQLKNHEDQVDAVMCAYIALYAHRFPERCELFGTLDAGYILTPTLKERWRVKVS
ncbi:DUF429 domain-containing protein [Deinococcus sonorensis]|uniref:DUF429 domain-containing protein n=2 Tax=Deinococcus sonorensis TaxID=309891 RepID=A0AAU7U867_9DEIO